MIVDISNAERASVQTFANNLLQYKRYLFNKVDFKSRLIGIKGARGSGKSTLLLQYAKSRNLHPPQLLYVSCDHPAITGIRLYDLAESFYARGGKLLLIDEIQRAPDFSSELKAIYDVFNLQVIFSGSSALQMEHASADLSRRAVVHHLGVLSFREFCELELEIKLDAYPLKEILKNHVHIVSELMHTFRPLEQFAKYLQYGCYPFYKESLTDYPLKLLEVINITIDSDLSRIYHIEAVNLDKLKKILYMLCTTNPYELNISKLSSAVGTSWPTLQKYLNQMDAGSLIHIVRGGAGMRAVNKPDKLLLHNPNLFTILCASDNLGSIRESFFVCQLRLQHQVHYHDRGDFVIDEEHVFEVGGADKTAKQLKKNNSKGYIVADNMVIGHDNKIPLWLLGFLY